MPLKIFRNYRSLINMNHIENRRAQRKIGTSDKICIEMNYWIIVFRDLKLYIIVELYKSRDSKREPCSKERYIYIYQNRCIQFPLKLISILIKFSLKIL